MVVGQISGQQNIPKANSEVTDQTLRSVASDQNRAVGSLYGLKINPQLISCEVNMPANVKNKIKTAKNMKQQKLYMMLFPR